MCRVCSRLQQNSSKLILQSDGKRRMLPAPRLLRSTTDGRYTVGRDGGIEEGISTWIIQIGESFVGRSPSVRACICPSQLMLIGGGFSGISDVKKDVMTDQMTSNVDRRCVACRSTMFVAVVSSSTSSGNGVSSSSS
jgi:hypothetical protein